MRNTALTFGITLYFIMNNRKFLTVMAVLDDITQQKLAAMQEHVTRVAGEGTQTMGIPFHITLGSYPTSDEKKIVERIKIIANETSSFAVNFKGFNSFGDAVLYLEPDIPEKLTFLREQFECDYANGFDWVPHATLFCADAASMKKAREAISAFDGNINASIVALELGEFFPPRKIVREQLK